MVKKDIKANRPIGVFDSGIGGLTVAKAISKELPMESLLYFGDTAHFPYGEKSAEAIMYYSEKISDFLLNNGAKAIVIACNTASSIAYEKVREHISGRIPVIDVISPVVEEVTKLYSGKKVGVIATKGTVRSDVYARKIKEKNPTVEVASLATPLLAPMIEEGFFNNKISRTIINDYLSRPKIKGINALILACTHYPLIRKEIEEYYHQKVTIVDSAEIVAQHVKRTLEKEGLINESSKPRHHFYVSDYTKSFEDSTRIFFQGKINLEYQPLWT